MISFVEEKLIAACLNKS